MSDWNHGIIEEFRTNAGKVGGYFEGATMLLLHTKGRKSGKEYINPLVYLPDGDRWVVFGTKGGAPEHPDWYFNLMANPDVEIEVGTETIPVHATEVLDDTEHDELYRRQIERREGFAEYLEKTDRRFPAIVLERR